MAMARHNFRGILAGLLLVAGMTVKAQAAGDQLLDLVPREVRGCVWLDLKALTARPQIRELLQQNEMKRFAELFAKQGLDLFQAFTAATFFSGTGDDGVLLLQTTVAEEQFRKLVEAERPDFDMAKLGERTVYLLGGQPAPSGAVDARQARDASKPAPIENERSNVRRPRGAKHGVAMYLQPGVMVVAETVERLSGFLQTLGSGERFAANPTLTAYRRQVPAGAAAWGVAEADPNAQPEQGQMRNPLAMIKGGMAAVLLGDPADPTKKDDLRMVIRLACKDANSANFGVLSLNGLLMMGIGQALSSDQALGAQLAQLLQFRPEQQDIVLDATLTGELIQRLRTAWDAKVAEMRTHTPRAGGGIEPPPSGETDDTPANPSTPEAPPENF